MMMLEYLIFSLETGEILRRLSCPAGLNRKANVGEGEGAVLAGDTLGVPDTTHRVDLATRRLVEKGTK